MARVLRGWKDPAPLLDAPTEKTFVNPFTGKRESFWSRQNPDQPSADEGAFEQPRLSDVQPVCVWKEITALVLAGVARALDVRESVEAAAELCFAERMNGPATAYGLVYRVPRELAERLATLQESDVRVVARRLMEIRAEVGFPPDTDEVAAAFLADLAYLAKRTRYPERMLFMHQGE